MHKFTIMTGAIMPPDPNEFPDKIGELNKLGTEQGWMGSVKELYGSLRTSYAHLPTARPDFRLEARDWDYLEAYIKACHRNGLIFNYTMNANFMGDLNEITKNYDKIIESLKKLESIGIDRVTVSHPILLNIICKNTNLPIECSTIMNINSLVAPHEIKKRYPNVNKICMSIDKIRDIDFVTNMKQVCKENGILLETMVSEFCTIGYMNCSQLHRPHCYNMHALNMTEEVARKGKSEFGEQPEEVRGYPWTAGKNGCIFGRSVNPMVWLGTKTIWPNEIYCYLSMTDVSQIKITTRTAPKEYALFLTEAYMKGEYNGLLAGLWLSLQASTLSARENFNNIQEGSVSKIPYTCEALSTPRKMSMHMWNRGAWHHFEGDFSFMDIFFTFTDIDWENIIWVDKPDAQLRPFESNWLHKWHKALTEE